MWGFTSLKLRSFLEQIFLLLFRQPCVQFGLQATRPLKDYPRNIGGLSGRGIQLFADYSNQERTVQEKGVYREVGRTATRKHIKCDCCELLLWKWKSFCR